MDAGIVDLDQDGDMDILIANEHRSNILLINDGKAMGQRYQSKRSEI